MEVKLRNISLRNIKLRNFSLGDIRLSKVSFEVRNTKVRVGVRMSQHGLVAQKCIDERR